ncbi:MAG: glycosyltransferase [Candidatus Levyibacteriota bacterium]
MGGSEKLVLELANATSKKEDVVLMDVSANIANIYGRIFLKRTFDNHIKDHNIENNLKHISLTFSSFMPFTKDWHLIRNDFQSARLLYVRYELLEILICLYFGGLRIFEKIIAGLILTPFYDSPRGLLDHFHNLFYGSFIYKYLLRSVCKIQVLNKREKKLLNEYYKVNNVYFLPVGININSLKMSKYIRKADQLNIIYVGELSTRKGVDTLLEIISNSPKHFLFHIVGDGPLKESIENLEKVNTCYFYKYVSSEKLNSLFNKCDVLVFPSRSEAFGIVMAEAMRYGLKIVNSAEVSLDLPKNIETSLKTRDKNEYIKALENIYKQKKHHSDEREIIQKYAIDNYSDENINKRFLTSILEI